MRIIIEIAVNNQNSPDCSVPHVGSYWLPTPEGGGLDDGFGHLRKGYAASA